MSKFMKSLCKIAIPVTLQSMLQGACNYYLIMIMPILVSEFLWSLGQNVESAVYGHLGTSNLAAYTLTCPIQGLIVGALSGLSAAAGVMVGKRLGRLQNIKWNNKIPVKKNFH